MIRRRWGTGAALAACTALTLAAAPRAAAQMTDAKILGHVLAANQGEVTLGQWVSSNTQNDAVRAFAQMLVTDHGNGVQHVQSTIQNTGIQPDATEQANVANEAAQTLQMLQSQSGAEMDRHFAHHAVMDHQKDIRETQRTIAAAHNPAVRQLLQGMMPVLQKHLAAAQQLAALVGPPTGMDGMHHDMGGMHHGMGVHKDNGR
jgi:putative membrane protein